jgi:rod shape-determining protein MreC
MKKRASFSYFVLALLCFSLLNFRFSFIENIRGPFFGFEELFAARATDQSAMEIAELKAENLHLKQQLSDVKTYLQSEDYLENLLKKCAYYENDTPSNFSTYYKRRLDETIDYLNIAKWQVSANVIYREPSNWGSSVWVDVGQVHNKMYRQKIIAIDSPVILGDHLIGVVEKVDKHKSLVRLITDSKISPSVRCVRGHEQDILLKNSMHKLIDVLSLQEGDKYAHVIKALSEEVKLSGDDQSQFLAKGVLHGSSHPVWRSRSLELQGVGFNYDFGDQEGAPRLLHEESKSALFQKGDALLTTGMDGVFPPNLLVAFVSEVKPLKEGAVSCDLKAKIALPEFSDLRKVTILPPIN